jgi:alpha-tubulin suppressor-like RCC1 family protein
LQEQTTDRRVFLATGAQLGAGLAFASFLSPLKSYATVFNTGAFIRRRTLPVSGYLFTACGNTYGEMADNSIAPKSSPVQVGSLTDWLQVSNGLNASAAIKSDGTLWTWGRGTSGALGNGSTASKSSPTQVGALTNWTQVAVGHNGTCHAVKTDGTLWAWGSDANGGLGTGTSGTSRSSPVQIGALTTWKFVATGNYFGVAIKTDGTLWSWGVNNYGQLGKGDITSRSTPVQIGTGTNWSKVSAGYEHVLAIKTDGTLWGWGNTGTGAIGDGSIGSKSSPVQIGALTTWSQVSCGVYHSVVLRNDGTLWGMGNNYSGQAAGGTGDKSSPTQLGTLSTWAKVQAGYELTFAIKADGTLWTIGDGGGG